MSKALLPENWMDLDLRRLARIAPLQEIALPALAAKGVRLSIKREDLLHPLLGGNKLYKLHGYIQDYRRRGLDLPIATFGGAYSNHIIATAAAAKDCGIPAIGIIRGERPLRLSATLCDAEALGMELCFVSRSDYKSRGSNHYRAKLERDIGQCYWIPEGGAGTLGAKGLIALADGISAVATDRFNAIFHACGTGSSIAGLAAGFAESASSQTQGCYLDHSPVHKPAIYGVSVLKSHSEMEYDIAQQLEALGAKNEHWRVFHDYHGGGYAKLSEQLASFMQTFEGKFEEKLEKKPEDKGEERVKLLLDPVYTAKMMWAICDLAERDFFPRNAHIVAVHSGGLQGRRGFARFSTIESTSATNRLEKV